MFYLGNKYFYLINNLSQVSEWTLIQKPRRFDSDLKLSKFDLLHLQTTETCTQLNSNIFYV